jgi:hypothetical protein
MPVGEDFAFIGNQDAAAGDALSFLLAALHTGPHAFDEDDGGENLFLGAFHDLAEVELPERAILGSVNGGSLGEEREEAQNGRKNGEKLRH